MVHTAHKQVGRLALGMVLLLNIAASGARAELTTEAGASIISFPKVIAGANQDTVIQITNVSNMAASARCLYLVANGTCLLSQTPCALDTDCPTAGETCVAAWTERNFLIDLTAQQPTHWVVSQGRPVNPLDTATGIDPGTVPPVPTAEFRGALLCVQVDASGLPLSGNALVGEATLKNLTTGDVAKYNAIGLPGLSLNNADDALCLGGMPSAACPNGAEYDGCPASWRLDHLAFGAPDDLIGPGSAVRTELTIVPCSEDFVTLVPQTFTVLFTITNEFEQTLSAIMHFTCWSNAPLTAINSIFNFSNLGTAYAQTSMRPVAGSTTGFLVLAEEFRDTGGSGAVTASAAVNVHAEGTRATPDRIVLPPVP